MDKPVTKSRAGRDTVTMREADAQQAGAGGAPVDTGRRLDLVALWRQHHLAFATAGCALFLIAGGLLDGSGAPLIATTVLFAAAYVCGGTFSLIGGIRTLIEEKRIDVDLLMVLASLAAASIGEWVEGGILLFLFSLSNALQYYAMDRTRRAITALMSLRPRVALLKEPGGGTRLVPVDSLAVGDVIYIRPGELVPIDGVIISGSSYLNEASITGESIPIDKSVGDEVFGGTLNQNGTLEVSVTKTAEDTVIAKIIRMVEEAQSEEAPTQRTIDTIEQYYAAAVVAVTVLAAVIPPLFGQAWSDSVYRAITLMVVASPCAVAMAVPAPVVAAIANGARSGILFKGGIHIENMAELKAVAFDKTGTLTEGTPRVTDVVPVSGTGEEELLSLAAAIESRSEHLLAKAIVAHAKERGVSPPPAEQAEAVPGQGIVAGIGGKTFWAGNRRLVAAMLADPPREILRRAERLEEEGKTVMFVGGDRLLGIIAVIDRLRPGAAEALRSLKESGVQRIVMLTGDNHRAAAAIAAQAGVDEVHSQLLPNEKVALIEALRRTYGSVAMVGDGVNDAPALARATLGIAMGAAGTDVALETADVVLMSNDLGKLAYALKLSRRAKRIIWQNIIFALGVIAVLVATVLTSGIVLAAGVVGHEGSTLLVIANSLRLLVGRHQTKTAQAVAAPAQPSA